MTMKHKQVINQVTNQVPRVSKESSLTAIFYSIYMKYTFLEEEILK